ncbi:Cd2+/Zn2+-exporting ATPase [Chitinophaga skermanii]|uniref:P-type Zn(2+) transporter n=1 Tax=Chitinophaga skermanii TaxID=331697 RepID=A0A327QLG2_9BACT|nr:heavy metal translocating P-type ATPase [Chitinophaga skermanii]RAJ05389.1 Cd2+/Zn2+-exporting ATPase [Chitinophaga skermanii]
MEKLTINIDLVLPGVPSEKDACVERIIHALTGRQGIEKVHIVPGSGENKAQLCFHYNPAIITVDRVEKMAQQAGAEILDRYHHLLIPVKGIRHQRQTRLLEAAIRKLRGVLSVSVSAAGMVFVETDATELHDETVYDLLRKEGLTITAVPTKAHDHAHDHDHEHGEEHHHEGHDHNHQHGGIFGERTELIFSLLCGAMLGIGFGLSFLPGIPTIVPFILYIAAYFFGGFFTATEAVQTIRKGGFEIDFLMLVAAIGAAILGNWVEGALLLFLFSLGHALEHFAMEKARKSIAALTALAPKTAFLKTGDGMKEVDITSLNKGDVIIIKPNTKIAADGIIIKGSSSINQAPITGESIPVDKHAYEQVDFNIETAAQLDDQYKVYAGTINGNDSIEVRVIKEAKDSTLSRLVQMVNEAQTQKSPTQQFTDKFERIFVPFVLVLVTLLCFVFLVRDETFNESFYRAMSVLVAASPCALAISTPSAVLSGVARAARMGVLIKGGRPLEDLGSLKALAFDKTGTLTEGKPKLTQIVPLINLTEEELLKIVVAVEALSDHPIAKAIVRDGRTRLAGTNIPVAHNMEAVLGKGIKATLNNDTIMIGNLALFNQTAPGDVQTQVKALEKSGNTTMVVLRNEEYIGIIAVMDTPRKEAKAAIAALQQVGIQKMVMLTGDNQQVAEAVAAETGIQVAMGGLLPADKVSAIQQLMKEEQKVAMVGDGVNDAPAMANSTVGIAMGAAGSDVALETADIALMGDNLSLLPFAIGLSRQAKKIIKQNLVISLGVVALLIPCTIFGIATIGPAVIAHEGSTLIVVFNALRLLAYKR